LTLITQETPKKKVMPIGKRFEKGNKASPGRPSNFRDEYCEQVEKLCKLGAIDAEIADFFDVSVDTINEWKKAHPRFAASIKAGKIVADMGVADALYRRATGFAYPSEKLFHFQGEIIRAPIVEHVPPDTGACKLWLSNRRSDKWRDKQDIGLNGDDAFLQFLKMMNKENPV
jgi:hypothetical protein